jgi:hypothetical protein
MLRIYICPNCYNFRMVSRKPDAICFHCGTTLEKCDINYVTYMNMTEEDRNTFKDNYKLRMSLYHDKVKGLYQEQ